MKSALKNCRGSWLCSLFICWDSNCGHRIVQICQYLFLAKQTWLTGSLTHRIRPLSYSLRVNSSRKTKCVHTVSGCFGYQDRGWACWHRCGTVDVIITAVFNEVVLVMQQAGRCRGAAVAGQIWTVDVKVYIQCLSFKIEKWILVAQMCIFLLTQVHFEKLLWFDASSTCSCCLVYCHVGCIAAKPQSAELCETNGRMWVTMPARDTVHVSGSSRKAIAALCCNTPQDSTPVEMSWCSCLFMSQQFPPLHFLEERKTSQDRSLLTLWPN